MKEYKKPAMVALSLSANDALCGCANSIKGTALADTLVDQGIIRDVTGDGSITQADFENGFLFASVEDKCGESHIPPGFDIYCKFMGTNTLAWS